MARTPSADEKLAEYGKTIGPMDDDQLLDEIDQNDAAHKNAPPGQKTEALGRVYAAQAEAQRRFGFGWKKKLEERRAARPQTDEAKDAG